MLYTNTNIDMNIIKYFIYLNKKIFYVASKFNLQI